MNDDRNDRMPKRWTLTLHNDYMHMQKIWRSENIFIMALLFIGILGLSVYIFIRMDSDANEWSGFFKIIVPFIFATIALGLGYTSVANRYNKTDIFVSDELLEIKIGPIKWPGNQKIEAKGIIQFFTRKIESGSGTKRHVRYEIWYQLEDGRRSRFLSGFTKQNNAEFIEKKLEEYLNIKDLIVRG